MKKIIIFIIIIILTLSFSFIVIYIFLMNNQRPIINSESSLNLNKIVSNPKLKEEYEEDIKEILKDFSDKNTPIEETVDKILQLIVPVEYKDLHLNLVIALNKIKTGKDNFEQARIEEGLNDLEKIRKEYNWLPEILKSI